MRTPRRPHSRRAAAHSGFVLGALIFARADIGAMFGASFSADATVDRLEAGAHGWAQARVYAMASGVIGMVIGVIAMLKDASDLSDIGPGLAMSLLTVFYGLALGYGICLPMQSRLEARARQAVAH